MEAEKPDAVFLCAATVGGILANDTRPAEFIYDNLMIEANVIHGAICQIASCYSREISRITAGTVRSSSAKSG